MEVDEEMGRVLYNHFSVGKLLAIAVQTNPEPTPLHPPTIFLRFVMLPLELVRALRSNTDSSRARHNSCHRFNSQGPGSEP